MQLGDIEAADSPRLDDLLAAESKMATDSHIANLQGKIIALPAQSSFTNGAETGTRAGSPATERFSRWLRF